MVAERARDHHRDREEAAGPAYLRGGSSPLGGQARSLAKDYEHHDLYSESMVYLASIGSLLRRLAPNPANATRYHITARAA